MKLIIGLGNPGKEYEQTRHNAGFWILDHLAKNLKTDWRNSRLRRAIYAKTELDDVGIILAKPTTFMNLSGNAASSLASYYKISPQDILIIHDDMDLSVGAFSLLMEVKQPDIMESNRFTNIFPTKKLHACA